MTRFLLAVAAMVLTFGAPELWWMGRAVLRCHRSRRTPGRVVRAGLSLYAAVTTLLAVVSFVTLSFAYGLGIVIAVVLAPFAISTAVSAELLWDKHPRAAAWLAAVPLALASLGIERVAQVPDLSPAAPWLHALTGVQIALALGVLFHGRTAAHA
jgi:hypothetical protein